MIVAQVQYSFLQQRYMASNGIANGGFAFSTPAVLVPNGLSKIKTKKTVSREVCKDGDTAAAPLKGVLQNVDDLHALQKKKASAPSTPKSPMNPSTPRNMTPRAAYTSEEERHKQQMESIRYQAPPTPSQIMRVQYSCTAFYCTIFRPIAAPVHQSNCLECCFWDLYSARCCSFAVHHWHRWREKLDLKWSKGTLLQGRGLPQGQLLLLDFTWLTVLSSSHTSFITCLLQVLWFLFPLSFSVLSKCTSWVPVVVSSLLFLASISSNCRPG